MKCERAIGWLSDYVDGSIDPARQVVLEAHLAACAGCSRELAGLRNVWEDLGSLPRVEPPVALRAMIWQRIEAAELNAAEPAVRRQRRRWFLWARTAAAAVGIAAIVILARVTVPGPFRTAGWTFWSGARAPQSSSPSGPSTVSGSSRLVPAREAGSATDQVHIALRIMGGPWAGRIVLMGPEGPIAQRAVTLSRPGITMRMDVPADAQKPLEVRVEWQAAPAGGRLSRTFPIRH